MKNKSIIIFLILFSFFKNKPLTKALCIAPIADLITEPFERISKNKNIEELYNTIPIFSLLNYEEPCQRINQIIFNEIVEITHELKDEIKINLLNIYTTNFFGFKKKFTGWALKKNFITFDQLKKSN